MKYIFSITAVHAYNTTILSIVVDTNIVVYG